MKNQIIFFIILFPLQLFCQMTHLYPKISSDQILDLQILNLNEIIIINDGGGIYKSNDAGYNWELKKFYPGYSLDEMHFINAQIGFVKTFKNPNNQVGLIYTTDAGETWNNHEIEIANKPSFMPISETRILKSTYEGTISLLDNFFNEWQTTYYFPTFIDTCFDCGFNEMPYGMITQFEKLNSGSLLALGVNNNAYNAQIIDDSLSIILKSTDLGNNWDTTWVGLADFVSNISFNNDTLGWLNTNNEIFKTIDGGINWTNQNILGINYYITDISAVADDELFGITSRFSQQLIKSVNSGSSWELIDVEKEGDYQISFYDVNNGFLYGSDLIKTEDGGESWIECDSSFKSNIYDIEFVSLDNGLSLGNEGLFITEDGGQNWNKQFEPEGIYYTDPGNIEMITEMLGWLITKTKIYKTTDGGYTWENFILSNNDQMYGGIEFFNENLGIIYTVSEEISPNYFAAKYHYLTTDGGENWEAKLIGEDSVSQYPGVFNEMEFTDTEHLWAVNVNGIWLSTDSASTWQQKFSNDYPLGNFTFDFYNSSTGIFTKAGDIFYFTNDGGETWTMINKVAYNNPIDCEILGPDYSGRFRILEVGTNGTLLRHAVYSSGVVDYAHVLQTYTGNNLNKIFVLEKNRFPNVWIAGNGFTVLYRQWELIFTGFEDELSKPNQFDLYQNYPNPFNPTTSIKFTIPKYDFVTLKIYDLLGREITTLVNEAKLPGVYEVEFDGTNLASGIYIYRLKSGGYTASKKFVLMK